MTDSANLQGGIVGLATGILDAMVGRRIVGVTYKTSTDPIERPEQGDRAVVHDVDHAVLISTASMTMVLEWGISNYDEFLNIVDSPDEGGAAAVTDVLDATGLPQWRPLVGSAITGFGVATQQSEDERQLLWSIRLDVENGVSVVVALGETEGELPSYQPDNLVVIFDPEMARSYRFPGASESAWGHELHM
jgi:hypothetical protein